MAKNRCSVCDKPFALKDRQKVNDEWFVICKVCEHFNMVDGPKVKEPKPPKVPKAPKPPKEKKPEKTEADLVRQYANVIVAKHRTRGMMQEHFKDLAPETTLNKNLWRDSDFFVSIVFQSGAQKYDFLAALAEKFNIESLVDEDDGKTRIQIINGLRLAQYLGIVLKNESTLDYPAPNMDLQAFILDAETF